MTMLHVCVSCQVRREVDLMRSKHGVVPGLAVIMVGERRDSAKYVSMKQVKHTAALLYLIPSTVNYGLFSVLYVFVSY